MAFWHHNEHRIGFSPSAKYKLPELVHKPPGVKEGPCRREMGEEGCSPERRGAEVGDSSMRGTRMESQGGGGGALCAPPNTKWQHCH